MILSGHETTDLPYELHHGKTGFLHMRKTKAQISCAVTCIEEGLLFCYVSLGQLRKILYLLLCDIKISYPWIRVVM